MLNAQPQNAGTSIKPLISVSGFCFGRGRDNMFIEEAITKYLEHRIIDLKEKTVKVNYSSALKKFSDFFYCRRLTDLTEQDVSSYRQQIKNKYSHSHFCYNSIILKGFLKYWCRRGYFTTSPVEDFKIPKYHTKPHDHLTYEEFKNISHALPEATYHDITVKLIIHLLWWTGMRVSELCDLNLSQIDNVKREMVIKTKKSNKLRVVTWDDSTHKLLCQYLGVRLCQGSGEAMFSAQGNKRITPRTVQRYAKIAAKLGNVSKKISPHSFRHGIIHYLKTKGVTDSYIQTYIGHTSVESTIKNYMVWDMQELGMIKNHIVDKAGF